MEYIKDYCLQKNFRKLCVLVVGLIKSGNFLVPKMSDRYNKCNRFCFSDSVIVSSHFSYF